MVINLRLRVCLSVCQSVLKANRKNIIIQTELMERDSLNGGLEFRPNAYIFLTNTFTTFYYYSCYFVS